MIKTYLQDTEIFVVENFLTQESLDYFDEKIKQSKWNLEQDWEPWSYNVERIDQEVTDRILDRIQSLLTEKYSWLGCHMIQRITQGNGLDEHLDKSDLEEQENSVGVAIYLNDNFDGGEIYYPNLGISYKPLRGALICHPGTAKYMHGVNKVLGNDRYILSSYGLKAVD